MSPDLHRLKLTRPAIRWEEAFPLGNGTLGAMVFGQPDRDRLALNHEALWRGLNRNLDTPIVEPDRLAAIRAALFARDFQQARELCDAWLSGPDPVASAPDLETIQPYQPFGDLLIDQPGAEYGTHYQRHLDLSTAVAATTFSINGVAYRRECLVSVPDQVLVIRLSADRPGAISCGLRLQRLADPDCQLEPWRTATGCGFTGCFTEGIRFAAQARVSVEGGELIGSGAADLLVRRADAVTISLAMAVAADADDPEPAAACRQTLDDAPDTWEQLCERHLAEYRPQWQACSLTLAASPETESLSLEERLQRRGTAPDPALDALYFGYGRYLLLASSRACRYPANLQGIWNAQPRPPWNSDFHIDINLQMTYWPAEPLNLSACTKPLFGFLQEMLPGARQAARHTYQCRGIHLGTGDRWQMHRYLAAGWDIWPTGGAWLAQHAWWHWLYERDPDWLREVGYPFLRENALFLTDSLVLDPQGRLVTAPSQSPENTFVGGSSPVSYCVGPTMDLVLAREVFTHASEAAEILGVDAALRETWSDLLAKLPPFQIGRHGQLQEWLDDEEENEPGHRHLSHLIGIYPGEMMTPERLPAFYEAGRVSLNRRWAAGAGQSGWSRAWCTALWARFREADKAYRDLTDLIANHTTVSMLNTHPIGAIGEVVVQLDGNFGGAAAITEMLLQAIGDTLRLLPALPAAWPDGEVRGLRAPGGMTLSLAWQRGALSWADIRTDDRRYVVIDLPEACQVTAEGAAILADGREPHSRRLHFEQVPGSARLTFSS